MHGGLRQLGSVIVAEGDRRGSIADLGEGRCDRGGEEGPKRDRTVRESVADRQRAQQIRILEQRREAQDGHRDARMVLGQGRNEMSRNLNAVGHGLGQRAPNGCGRIVEKGEQGQFGIASAAGIEPWTGVDLHKRLSRIDPGGQRCGFNPLQVAPDDHAAASMRARSGLGAAHAEGG